MLATKTTEALYPVRMPHRSLALAAVLLSTPFLSEAQTSAGTPPQDGGASMHREHAPAQPSTRLAIGIRSQQLILDLATLQAMPQVTVSVFNAHAKQEETYTGPLVSDVLAKVGVALDEKSQHELLDSYVIATGTDGYFVIFSAAEVQPGLHKAQAIVAISQAGQPLGSHGAFQLIDPLDVKPARWVRNLNSLTVVPVTMPLR